MKINFSRWNIGGKLIFSACCLAIFSLFLKWVDLGILSASGFQQDGYLFLVLFAYPAYVLAKNKPINRIGGLVSSVSAVLLGIYFALTKSIEVFGSTVNGAGSGLYLFILSAIALVIGVLKYESTSAETLNDSAKYSAGTD